MKIAFYISDMDKGGAQRVVLTLMESLLKEGYEILLITTRVGSREYELPEGIQRKLCEIPPERMVKADVISRINNFRLRIRLLRKVLKEERPDSTVAFMGKTNVMLLLASRRIHGRYYVSVRATPSEEYKSPVMRYLARTLFAKADGVILQTKQAADFFPQRIQKKVSILPNPLNTQFLGAPYEGERSASIVAVGRIDDNKNHRMIMHAFEEAVGRHPELSNYELVIYGDGELRETLMREAEQMSVRIRFPGQVPDVQDRIKDASLYVLSSDTEGMPNALLEAMALGLPCISTDCPCGGPATVIQNGVNGILVPVRDEETLSREMSDLLLHPDRAEALGKEALHIRESNAPDRVAEEWRRVIAE